MDKGIGSTQVDTYVEGKKPQQPVEWIKSQLILQMYIQNNSGVVFVLKQA